MTVRHVDRFECSFCGLLFQSIQPAYDHQREAHGNLVEG